MMMTRRERLMATLRGEPVDRPAVSFYEIGGFKIDPADPDRFNVYNDPSWQGLLQLAEEQTDLIRLRSGVKSRSHEVTTHKAQAVDERDEFGETGLCDMALKQGPFEVEEYVRDGSRFNRTTVTAGGRSLTSLTRRDPDVDTVWTVEHLIKDTNDLKAYLELPDDVFAEEVNVADLIEEDKQLGPDGIIMVDTEDPICAAASLFSMEDFTVVALTEPKMFHRLLEKLSAHIYARTERTAEVFGGHLWRIYGPEYAAEPYLPPHLFDEYVVRYTGPMIETIHRYGGFARVHCHGRIRGILDYIVRMGADAIDPIEPPPQGDVELEYVRGKYGEELVLFGNLEMTDIENTESSDFEKVVEKSLRAGTSGRGRGFVLCPTSAPYGREITPRVMANYETMVRLASSFGL